MFTVPNTRLDRRARFAAGGAIAIVLGGLVLANCSVGGTAVDTTVTSPPFGTVPADAGSTGTVPADADPTAVDPFAPVPVGEGAAASQGAQGANGDSDGYDGADTDGAADDGSDDDDSGPLFPHDGGEPADDGWADPPQGGGGGGGDGGGDDGAVELDPVPPVDPPPNPCDQLVPDGSSLVVGPDPLVLDDGVLHGSIAILNCSDGDIDWTASTKPSVQLDDNGANLLPGEHAKLDFTIVADAWDPGAVDFKIKVSEPGHNHYVDVHAFRQLSGKDFVPAGIGLSAGEGAGGCANQCIVSALLQPNFSSPNMSLEITTNTPARIHTRVSKQAPIEVNGVPTFPGNPGPMDASPDGVTNHVAGLSPLDAGTDYHIVVSATDEHGHTSYRVGTFTTITAVENPGDFVYPGENPGCSDGCITTAMLTPGDEYSRHYTMTSDITAQMQVTVSTEEPTWSAGVPSFAHSVFWQPSGLEYLTQWETDITELSPDTTYWIIAVATDPQGRTDHRVGTFRTPALPPHDVEYVIHRVHIDDDGDAGVNRGEIALGWWVGNHWAGYRSEDRVSTGDTVHFSESQRSFVVHGVTEYLPIVTVEARERDAVLDCVIEATDIGVAPAASYTIDHCKATVAVGTGGGITTLASLGSLQPCGELGVDAHPDARCYPVVVDEQRPDYADVTAYVSVRVLN